MSANSPIKFNPVNLNQAIRIICHEFELQEHEVREPLCDVFEFGLDKRTCSVERITQLWHDHCAYRFFGDFDIAA